MAFGTKLKDMKKILILLLLLPLIVIMGIASCQKSELKTSSISLRKGKPKASTATFSVYYSPDASTPYVCYIPCTRIPLPTGIDPVSNSGTVIQISLQGLGYTSGFDPNYSDSIQYLIGDGNNSVCWTEKWCNTNGAYIPISQLQPLLNQAGINTNNLTTTVIPYGDGGQSGTTFTTSFTL